MKVSRLQKPGYRDLAEPAIELLPLSAQRHFDGFCSFAAVQVNGRLTSMSNLELLLMVS